MSRLHQITSLHARAICDEVGERLRHLLRDDYTQLPPFLQQRLDRLSAPDCDAPSLVPLVNDLAAPPQPGPISSKSAAKAA